MLADAFVAITSVRPVIGTDMHLGGIERLSDFRNDLLRITLDHQKSTTELIVECLQAPIQEISSRPARGFQQFLVEHEQSENGTGAVRGSGQGREITCSQVTSKPHNSHASSLTGGIS